MAEWFATMCSGGNLCGVDAAPPAPSEQPDEEGCYTILEYGIDEPPAAATQPPLGVPPGPHHGGADARGGSECKEEAAHHDVFAAEKGGPEPLNKPSSAGSSGARCATDALAEADPDAELEAFVSELQSGGILIAKYARNGVRTDRRLLLDGAAATLTWPPEDNCATSSRRGIGRRATPSVALAAITEVRLARDEDPARPGYMGTEVLRLWCDVRSAGRCFSLITSGRTLDLELPESDGAKQQTERLALNLRRLIERARRAAEAAEPPRSPRLSLRTFSQSA